YYAYSFLPVSYLTSLGVGYFSGYLLLVFRNRDANSRKRTHPLVRVLNLGVTACLWALLPLVAIVLVCRNLPTVLALRSESLRGYFSEVERFLPPKDAVILSDDPFRLMLLESFLDQHGKHSASLLIDTAALANPNYFPFLNRQYPQFKLATLCTNAPAEWRRPITAIQFLQTLSKSHPLYYLQPSFGLFFEFFYLEPHGLVYQMKPLPEGTAIPPLSPDVVAENQTFWQTKSGQFLSLAKANAKPRSPAKPTLLQRLEKSAHLKNDPDLVARILGISYSRAVDYWGVQMQKAGAYKEAEVWFTQAGDLNPDNVVAQVNLQFNQNFQASKPVVLYDVKTMEERLGYHRKWDQILNDLGPFDDPNYCYQLGMYFLQSSPGLPHQALQQLERVETLAPGIFRFAPFIVLQLLCYIHEYPSALAKADNLLAQTTDDESRSQVFDVLLAAQRYSNVLERAEAILKNSPTDRLGLFYKGASLLHLQSTDEALASLNRLTQVYTNDETLYQVFELMFAAQKYSNVVQMTDADLKSAPDNPTLLMYNGVARLRMQSYHEALTPLSHLLQLQPTNYLAYLNRGIAHLKLEDLDAARPDYVAAAEIKTNAFQAYYGLGEIAYRQKDFPDALKNYKIYLTLAPTNTEEAVLISKREPRRPTRVTHVITPLIVGGAHENTIASVLGLRNKPGLEVHLISGPTSGPEGSLESSFASTPGLLSVLPELVRPIHPWKDLLAWRRLTGRFRAHPPDLVHTHSGKAGVIGRLAAARAGVPLIVHTIHGPSFGAFQGALANSLFLCAERRAARVTTHFVTVANAMTGQYLAAGIGRPQQFTRILSGFPLEPFLSATNDSALRARLKIRPDDLVVGKVARLFKLKGHDDLFRVAPRLVQNRPNLKFLL